MGANIDAAGNIEIDFTHQKIIDTSIVGNPTTWAETGFTVLSIMQRKRDVSIATDGNPVIHALKGRPKYSISARQVARLSRQALHIARRLGNQIAVDAIVVAPSSHRLNAYMATRLQRHVFPRAQIFDCLEKRTLGEIIAAIKSTPMSQRDRREAGRLLATLEKGARHASIEMKRVDKKLTRFVHPVKLKPTADLPPEGMAILLVEDIYSSGQTIRACVTELRTACQPSEINVLTLFSPLRTPTRNR